MTTQSHQWLAQSRPSAHTSQVQRLLSEVTPQERHHFLLLMLLLRHGLIGLDLISHVTLAGESAPEAPLSLPSGIRWTSRARLYAWLFYVSSRDQTRVLMLAIQAFYSSSHLPSPVVHVKEQSPVNLWPPTLDSLHLCQVSVSSVSLVNKTGCFGLLTLGGFVGENPSGWGIFRKVMMPEIQEQEVFGVTVVMVTFSYHSTRC